MIIKGNQIQNVLASYGEQIKATKNAKMDNASPTQQKDEVILSSTAQEFAQVLQTARNMSSVRGEKVQEYSEKISSGTYQVDANDIAEKIIGSYAI